MNIAELRKSRGMTQKQLAEQVGVNVRWIQKIEHGDIDIKNITFINGIKLLRALYDPEKDEDYYSTTIVYKMLKDLLKQA